MNENNRQACEMILQRYQVSSKDILNVMYDDCVQNPGVAGKELF